MPGIEVHPRIRNITRFTFCAGLFDDTPLLLALLCSCNAVGKDGLGFAIGFLADQIQSGRDAHKRLLCQLLQVYCGATPAHPPSCNSAQDVVKACLPKKPPPTHSGQDTANSTAKEKEPPRTRHFMPRPALFPKRADATGIPSRCWPRQLYPYCSSPSATVS
jgi:hypothetical protein